jgi:hypothetical protein
MLPTPTNTTFSIHQNKFIKMESATLPRAPNQPVNLVSGAGTCKGPELLCNFERCWGVVSGRGSGWGGNNVHLPDFFDSSFLGIDLQLIALSLHGPRFCYVKFLSTVGLLCLCYFLVLFTVGSLRLCYVVASFSHWVCYAYATLWLPFYCGVVTLMLRCGVLFTGSVTLTLWLVFT